MRNMKLTAVDYHRNGVGGVGFYAVAFTYKEGIRTHRMIATVFCNGDDLLTCNGYVSVINADMAAAGQIGDRPINKWQSDLFEPQLRQWIARWEQERSDELNRIAALSRTAMAAEAAE